MLSRGGILLGLLVLSVLYVTGCPSGSTNLPEPTATAIPIGGPAPLGVQFTGTSNDTANGPFAYSWDFGDGGTSSAQNPSYTYPVGTPPGNYRVALTVRDGEGKSRKTELALTVTVGDIATAQLAEPGIPTEIVTNNPASPLHTASVSIPAGALPANAVITIGEATMTPPLPVSTVPLVELGPEGTTFVHPVTVTVPVSNEVADPSAVRVIAFNKDEGRWTDAGISNVQYLGGPDRLLQFDTTHFTFFSTMDTWTIASLGTLGGVQSYGFAINESAQITGYSYPFVSTNWRLAFLWESGNAMLSLGSIDKHSYGYGINDANPVQIVGYTQPDGYSEDFRAFIWDATNGMQDLGNLGGSAAIGQAVNDSGTAVGFSYLANGDNRAFRWDSTNGMQDLGTLGGDNSAAYGINDAGQVVGSSDPPPGNKQYAFVWDSTNGMQNLGLFAGGKFAVAYDINEVGEAVGQVEISNNGPRHAALWDSGGPIDLGTLGGNTSLAYAINDSTQVVGRSETASSGTHAFGWDDDGGGAVMTDLNDLLPSGSGWVLNEAWGINNAGDITGFGTRNGAVRAFLLQRN